MGRASYSWHGSRSMQVQGCRLASSALTFLFSIANQRHFYNQNCSNDYVPVSISTHSCSYSCSLWTTKTTENFSLMMDPDRAYSGIEGSKRYFLWYATNSSRCW